MKHRRWTFLQAARYRIQDYERKLRTWRVLHIKPWWEIRLELLYDLDNATHKTNVLVVGVVCAAWIVAAIIGGK